MVIIDFNYFNCEKLEACRFGLVDATTELKLGLYHVLVFSAFIMDLIVKNGNWWNKIKLVEFMEFVIYVIMGDVTPIGNSRGRVNGVIKTLAKNISN